MSERISNAIILVGNTGVGKSYLCNKLFEYCASPTRFTSDSSTKSVTQTLQMDKIQHNGNWYTLLDSPGFFDTNSTANDGNNMCKLVNAIEKCDLIYALIFVFTDRFSTPHKIWFDRMAQLITEKNHGHIILLHNKQNDYSESQYLKNSMEIDNCLGGGNHNYVWFTYKPDLGEVGKLLDRVVKLVPFKIDNFVVPEVCYEREETGVPYEEVVSTNTSDEGQMVEQVRDTSHYESVEEWSRGGRFTGSKKWVQKWVPSQAIDQIWVPKMVTRRTIKTYQDVYKVRFDGSKDLHCKIEINSRVEVDN